MSMAAAFAIRPLTVLLVEDDDGDAKAVERAFRMAKVASPIVRAVDGVEALELIRGTDGKARLAQPYLLFVDLNMPRMGGIALVRALREDAELRHAVVFMLTTSKRDEDRIAAYDLNVAGYILKETAGQDFQNLVRLVDCYRRMVELP